MPHRIVPQQQLCTACNKKFIGPNYEGCTADVHKGKHTVAPQQFYSPSGGLQLQWKTERTFPDPEGRGNIVRLPGQTAQFVGGVFISSDPEEIDYMRDYPGLCSYDKWFEIFVPEKERVAKALRENKQSAAVIDSQNSELRDLRKRLNLDPDTGKPLQQ